MSVLQFRVTQIDRNARILLPPFIPCLRFVAQHLNLGVVCHHTIPVTSVAYESVPLSVLAVENSPLSIMLTPPQQPPSHGR